MLDKHEKEVNYFIKIFQICFIENIFVFTLFSIT